MGSTPVISVVGKSGVGKTTFLEKLVGELKKRNIRVGVIKHHVHETDVDRPGKDTWRISQAGADKVALSTPGKVGVFVNTNGEMDLDDLTGMFYDMDIILTEGYKRGNKPKIEVHRAGYTDKLVSKSSDLIAIVSDGSWELGVPVFGLEKAGAVADFIVSKYLAERSAITDPDKVRQALLKASKDGRISCTMARKLARDLNVSPQIISTACNECKIKIKACELGCF